MKRKQKQRREFTPGGPWFAGQVLAANARGIDSNGSRSEQVVEHHNLLGQRKQKNFMSVSSILSSNLFSYNAQRVQDRMQQLRKDFQQLGQDLQTGNLSGAQADFAAMQKDGPQSSSAQSSNPVAQAIQQLSTDLQSGNLTAAQQAYTNLQQDFQNQASPMRRPHHHQRNHSGGGQDTTISQVLSQLGQDLQSGDVASAQKAYSTLQQDLEQYAIANGALDGMGSTTMNASA